MLTRLQIRNFKRFKAADIELGGSVVLIGPNNRGKTTALQALALWEIGVRLWKAKRGDKASPEKRPGVAINRRDLIAIPVPDADLLWHQVHVRNVRRDNGKPKTSNLRIDVVVEGVTGGVEWSCGVEFDYSNEESLVCRPLRLDGFATAPVSQAKFSTIPEQAEQVRIAFLPPMSGLAAVEPKWELGRINVLLGEGQTAQVLRNLCHQIHTGNEQDWEDLVRQIKKLFGVKLLPPRHEVARGEITMEYEEGGVQLDLSSSGRGLQQTMLLLAHLYANPGTVLLLDEPDAHLEILRQRQTYQLITDIAERKGSQVIAASHSEVVLNEAADKHVVVSFVGSPHRVDDRGSQLLKSLKEIGFEHYVLAEQVGWVLYLEGSTDLAILETWARILKHPAAECLERPFVHYVGNQPAEVRRHFWGLRDAKKDLVGIALFDRLEREPPEDLGVEALQWRRREIENYLCQEDVLVEYARHDQPDDLFGLAEARQREEIMKEVIERLANALQTLRGVSPWSPDIKATDEFLDRLFTQFFEALGLPHLLRKTDYHELARLMTREQIDPEVVEKLDRIVATAKRARPKVD